MDIFKIIKLINYIQAWTLLVDLMFSSVRDGFYQELRRQRRQSPTHLKSLGESNVCTERFLANLNSNLKDCRISHMNFIIQQKFLNSFSLFERAKNVIFCSYKII